MSKFVILGDTHHGMRKDSQKFHKFAEEFYSKVFFPYLDKHKIKTVFQLGDLFDNRKSISPYTLSECKRYFFDELQKRHISFYTLLGNHDIFWKESLSISTTSTLLREYSNVVVIDQPTTIANCIDMIPWICKENNTQVHEYIKNSTSNLCFGHFEISGFKMYKGTESHDGISRELFSKYELVCSGHYHTRSFQDNILYVGTPMEMTWQDYDDQRGFHVYDIDSRTIEFIHNPFTIFSKIIYDDTKNKIPNNLDSYKEKFVKIVVTGKSDLYKFDSFLNKLYDVGVYDIKIIEDIADTTNVEFNDTISLEDTMGLLNSYIDNIEIQNKSDVKKYMKLLYTQALNLESV